MNAKMIMGVVLLVVGVAFLIFGLNASHSVADQVSNTFTGRFTEATTWYIVGGIGSALLGLLLMVARGRGRTACPAFARAAVFRS
jgi:branched-subunit amino acid permease